jgi:hypothetical protein
MFKPADHTSPPNQAWWTDHDNESTQTDGVLVLNTEVNPLWLDFRFKDGAGRGLGHGHGSSIGPLGLPSHLRGPTLMAPLHNHSVTMFLYLK